MIVTMKSTIFWDVMLCNLKEIPDISEEHTASTSEWKRVSQTSSKHSQSWQMNTGNSI
jgi:hypothetical protein